MTLKEFIKLNKRDHYRIYQPNRDCLIFESYLKVHSPYKFNNEDYGFNSKYFNDNEYCDNVYTNVVDKETKVFLKRFGKYKVVCIECGAFRPINMTSVDDNITITYTTSESRPNCQELPCFDVFIVPVKTKNKV